MPDWQELVRQRLSGLELEAAEREEVQAELAAHLEESYERFCEQGLPEKEASDQALEQVSDWQELRRKISAAKREGYPMKKRAQQLWIPGFFTLILSMIVLAIFLRLGFGLLMVGSGSGAVFFSAPWLASLPVLGALGASFSSRAGGSRRTMLLASVFPALSLSAAFLVMAPLGVIIDRITGTDLAFRAVASELLSDWIGWLLLPGAALLAGALLVDFFLSRRLSRPNPVVG